jgi:hypothetical protein
MARLPGRGSGVTDWALVTTMPSTELVVSQDLERRLLPHRLFKRRMRVAHRGRLVERLVPAFPRYVFVPEEDCFSLVENIPNLTGVVSFGRDRPARVRQHVIDQIAASCTSDDVLVEAEDSSRTGLKFGDEIFVDAAIRGRGRYCHATGGGRAVVLIEWLGRSIFANVNECDLRRRPPRRGRQRWQRSSSRNQVSLEA